MRKIVFPLLLALSVAPPPPASAESVGPRAGFTPTFGVRVVELEPRQLDELKLEFGVKVVGVAPGTAAEAAGLKEGDVLVELAGRPVYSTTRLRHLVIGLKEDEKFGVVYLRDGRKATVQAQIKPAPQAASVPRSGPPASFFGAPFFSRTRLGVQLQELTEELRTAFGVDSGAGVLVAEVLPDSAAKKAGVAAGDVIVRVDRRAIQRIADVHRALSCFEPGEELTLGVIRDKKPLTLTVKLEGASDGPSESAPRTSGREFLENLERGLREIFENFGEPAGPNPAWGL